MHVVQTLIRKLLFSNCSLQSCFSIVPYNSWGKCCIQSGLRQSKQVCLNPAECLKKTVKQAANDQTHLTETASFKKLQVLHEVLAHQDSDMNCQYYDTTLWRIPNLKSIQLRIKSVKNTTGGNMQKKEREGLGESLESGFIYCTLSWL